MCGRLAAIDGDDSYTSVKPQHRYVTCPAWHRPSPSYRFFFNSNKNYFVQLEDTKIKTERVCSMQRTEQTTVSHHSSQGAAFVPTRFRRRINFNEYNVVTVGNSSAIWTGAGSQTISRSQTSFQNSISALYSYRAPVQPALGPLFARWHVWTSASFYLQGLSTLTACAAMLRAG